MFSNFFGFGNYFGRNSGLEIFKIRIDFTVLVKIFQTICHIKKNEKWPQNIAIPFFFCFCYFLDPDWFTFSCQKSFTKFSVISPSKLNICGTRQEKKKKIWYMWQLFSWYGHNICNYEWPANSNLGVLVQASQQPPPWPRPWSINNELQRSKNLIFFDRDFQPFLNQRCICQNCWKNTRSTFECMVNL